MDSLKSSFKVHVPQSASSGIFGKEKSTEMLLDIQQIKQFVALNL